MHNYTCMTSKPCCQQYLQLQRGRWQLNTQPLKEAAGHAPATHHKARPAPGLVELLHSNYIGSSSAPHGPHCRQPHHYHIGHTVGNHTTNHMGPYQGQAHRWLCHSHNSPRATVVMHYFHLPQIRTRQIYIVYSFQNITAN